MNQEDKKLRRKIGEEVLAPIGIAVISIASPGLAAIATFVYGSTKVFKWRRDRIREIASEVGVQNILDLINKDDKSRDVLHKILLSVMDEHSKRKRKLFYEYIKKLHKGIHASFDYHTKIILTINSITFEELHTLVNFSRHYSAIVKKTIARQKKESSSAKVARSENLGIPLRDITASNVFRSEDQGVLEGRFMALVSYNLISISTGRYGGTFFGPITDFGKVFLEFIGKE